MTKSKYTKRALFSSVVALLLCFTMLLGTTFAWFTDTASTGSTVIQSGTLDIVLEMWNGTEWVNAEGQELKFSKKDDRFGDGIIFEPGCTYELPKIRVRNEGNLSAYAIVKLLGVTGDTKLMNVLEFKTTVSNSPLSQFEGKVWDMIKDTPDGDVLADWSLMAKGVTAPNSKNTDTTAEFTISVHMQEDAGNDYQNLKLEGVSIAVVATQAQGEYDSYNNTYDENAAMPADPTKATDAP